MPADRISRGIRGGGRDRKWWRRRGKDPSEKLPLTANATWPSAGLRVLTSSPLCFTAQNAALGNTNLAISFLRSYYLSSIPGTRSSFGAERSGEKKNGKEVELSVNLLDTVCLFVVVSLVWNEFSFSFPFGHKVLSPKMKYFEAQPSLLWTAKDWVN